MATYLTHWVDGDATETAHPCTDSAIDAAGAWCADEGADLVPFVANRYKAMRSGECIAIFAVFPISEGWCS
jgi:hypothetical protein